MDMIDLPPGRLELELDMKGFQKKEKFDNESDLYYRVLQLLHQYQDMDIKVVRNVFGKRMEIGRYRYKQGMRGFPPFHIMAIAHDMGLDYIEPLMTDNEWKSYRMTGIPVPMPT